MVARPGGTRGEGDAQDARHRHLQPQQPDRRALRRDCPARAVHSPRRHGLVVYSDEIYRRRLVYEGTHIATATLAQDVPIICFNGLSKAYLACGWRVGWMIFCNPHLTRELRAAVQRLADARLCSPAPQQYAVARRCRVPKPTSLR